MCTEPDDLTLVFDLETTGFRGLPIFSKCNRIIQIACMDLKGEYSPFVRFVHPGLRDIPPQSSAIHHIVIADVAEAAHFDEVFDELLVHFAVRTRNRVFMVSHNGTFFDEPVLRRHVGNKLPANVTFVDTLPIIRRTFPNLSSYTLTDVYRAFYGEAFENSHRADSDVYALRRICQDKLMTRLFTSSSSDTLTDLRYIAAYRARQIEAALGVRSTSELRERFIRTVGLLDRFLTVELRISDIAHRMTIAMQLYGYARMCTEVQAPSWLNGALNDVDYYVHTKYNSKKTAPVNWIVYQRGMMGATCEP